MTVAPTPKTEQFLADLRSAAALCREGDWRRVSTLFKDHSFKPLAYLAEGCAEAMKVLPVSGLGSTAILILMPAQRQAQALELLAIFGVPS